MALSFSDFPELQALQDFVVTNKVTVSLLNVTSIAPELIPVTCSIGNENMIMHLSDEYDDLHFKNPLLNVVLVLFELVIVEDSDDFLVWCNWQNLDPNNSALLSYYKSMCTNLEALKKYFPKKEITTFVSDLDFELNSGSMQLLRQLNKQL